MRGACWTMTARGGMSGPDFRDALSIPARIPHPRFPPPRRPSWFPKEIGRSGHFGSSLAVRFAKVSDGGDCPLSVDLLRLYVAQDCPRPRRPSSALEDVHEGYLPVLDSMLDQISCPSPSESVPRRSRDVMSLRDFFQASYVLG